MLDVQERFLLEILALLDGLARVSRFNGEGVVA
jgi:hypothetical protein